jgi:hypothetical protein
MVFMDDSERAATLARSHRVDAGLHLNFTTAYSARQCPGRLIEHQQKLSRFLRSHRVAPIVFHPGLAASFEYVVKAQCEEFERVYGAPADRFDGHHHMHLCANVCAQKLLPSGSIVRRNLSFGAGEKGVLNRMYRRWQDNRLALRHRQADFLFNLLPLYPRDRFKTICELGLEYNVEIETHPINAEEYDFLIGGELLRYGPKVAITQGYVLRRAERNFDTGGLS